MKPKGDIKGAPHTAYTKHQIVGICSSFCRTQQLVYIRKRLPIVKHHVLLIYPGCYTSFQQAYGCPRKVCREGQLREMLRI